MTNVSPERPGQLDVLESKYSLVIAVAKRARQIVNKREPGIVLPHKPVTIALSEIGDGRIRIVAKEEPAPDGPALAESPGASHEGELAEAAQGTEGASEVPEPEGPGVEKPE